MIPRRRLLLTATSAVAAVPVGARFAMAMQALRARRPIVMLVGALEGSEVDKMARVFAGSFGAHLGAPDALTGTLPAVLAVHVEDQVDGAVATDDAAQRDARQESLTGAGLAENHPFFLIEVY